MNADLNDSDDNLLITEEHEHPRQSVLSSDSQDSQGCRELHGSSRREVFRRLKAPRNPVMPFNHNVSRKKERITLEQKVMEEIRE